MNQIDPIAAAAVNVTASPTSLISGSHTPPPQNFTDMMLNGLHEIEHKVNTATDLVRAFAVDDSVPVHDVTIALAQARSSVELALQVRSRLVDGYRELMNMQL